MSLNNGSNDPLDFVKNMWGNMGFSLPGMVTPTLDTDELQKQITDLKAKLAESEGQLGRVKKAGSMTKLVGSSKPAAQDRKTPQASSVEDLDSAFDEAAKNMGMR